MSEIGLDGPGTSFSPAREEGRPGTLRSKRTGDDWPAALRSADAGAALTELHELVRRGLHGVLADRGEVGHADVEDYTQEAVTRILAGLDAFRGDSRFETWAMAIAIRTAFTDLRRRRWRDVSLEELASDDPGSGAGLEATAEDPSRATEREELLAALRRAIEEDLTDLQRTLILRKLAGVPSAVLVEELGTNSNAMYKLYHDARRRLKQALGAAGFDATEVQGLLQNGATA